MPRCDASVVFLTLCCLVLTGCSTSGRFLLSSTLPTNSGGQFNEPIGACCLPSGACLTVPASECNAYSGIFFGEGIICGIAPCSDLFTP